MRQGYTRRFYSYKNFCKFRTIMMVDKRYIKHYEFIEDKTDKKVYVVKYRKA